jgi:hypothetical protein
MGFAFSQDGNLTGRQVLLAQERAARVAAVLAAGHVRRPNRVSTSWAASLFQPEVGARISIRPRDEANHMNDRDRSPAIRAAVDLMLDLYSGPSLERNILGSHCYSIVQALFLDSRGDWVPLAAAAPWVRPTLFPRVDTARSLVRLFNPHHANEPDRHGDNRPTRPGDGAPFGSGSDGVFTLSLDQFFRNFSSVDSGVFARS